MLSIGKDLGTLKEATEYNQRISNYRCDAMTKGYSAGCISALACIECYHVISDSICLCMGTFICPKCGSKNTPRYLIGTKINIQFSSREKEESILIFQDYCI